MKLAELLAAFLDWCARYRSVSTAKQYRSRLRLLCAFDADKLTALDVETWYARASTRQNGRPKAPDSVRAAAIAYGAFQSWSIERGIINVPGSKSSKNPPGGDARIFPPRKRRRPFSAQQRPTSAPPKRRDLQPTSSAHHVFF